MRCFFLVHLVVLSFSQNTYNALKEKVQEMQKKSDKNSQIKFYQHHSRRHLVSIVKVTWEMSQKISLFKFLDLKTGQESERRLLDKFGQKSHLTS